MFELGGLGLEEMAVVICWDLGMGVRSFVVHSLGDKGAIPVSSLEPNLKDNHSELAKVWTAG